MILCQIGAPRDDVFVGLPQGEASSRRRDVILYDVVV